MLLPHPPRVCAPSDVHVMLRRPGRFRRQRRTRSMHKGPEFVFSAATFITAILRLCSFIFTSRSYHLYYFKFCFESHSLRRTGTKSQSWAEANSGRAKSLPNRKYESGKNLFHPSVVERRGSSYGMHRLEMKGRKPRAWKRPGGAVWIAVDGLSRSARALSRAKGVRFTGERSLTRYIRVQTSAPIARRVRPVACLSLHPQAMRIALFIAPTGRFARVMPSSHVGKFRSRLACSCWVATYWCMYCDLHHN